MQLPLSAFDVAEAHPLKEARRGRMAIESRAWAVAITLIAHIVAVTGIVEGLRQADIFVSPPSVTVHIEPERKKPEEIAPLPMPALVKPAAITAPIPIFTIAPPDPHVAPALPVAAPHVMPAAPVVQAPPSKAAITWQGLLLARLEQAKRYPAAAQARRQQGVVLLHFTMDREGRVLSATIQKGSGYDALDQEALAMIQRAQPLPRPPAEVSGDPIDLTVPVEFYLNRRK